MSFNRILNKFIGVTIAGAGVASFLIGYGNGTLSNFLGAFFMVAVGLLLFFDKTKL